MHNRTIVIKLNIIFTIVDTVHHLEPPREDEFLKKVKMIDEDQLNTDDDGSDSDDEEFLFKQLTTHYDPYDPFS